MVAWASAALESGDLFGFAGTVAGAIAGIVGAVYLYRGRIAAAQSRVQVAIEADEAGRVQVIVNGFSELIGQLRTELKAVKSELGATRAEVALARSETAACEKRSAHQAAEVAGLGWELAILKRQLAEALEQPRDSASRTRATDRRPPIPPAGGS